MSHAVCDVTARHMQYMMLHTVYDVTIRHIHLNT